MPYLIKEEIKLRSDVKSANIKKYQIRYDDQDEDGANKTY